MATGATLVALLLGACAAEPPLHSPGPVAGTPSPGPVVRSFGERVAAIAANQVGAPYHYGGSSTSAGFDCSGLVHYAYAGAGRQVPRTALGLWRSLRPVDRSELRPGDVLFFDIEGKLAHVGVYLGERRFVHAPASGRTVSVASLDMDYYRAALIRGGRP